MLVLLLKHWQKIALFAALLTAAWWFNGLLEAKAELSEAQVLISAQKTALDTYKQEEIWQQAQIADLTAAIQEVTILNKEYKDKLILVEESNSLLARELEFNLHKLEVMDIGDTCNKQVDWVISISKELGTWND